MTGLVCLVGREASKEAAWLLDWATGWTVPLYKRSDKVNMGIEMCGYSYKLFTVMEIILLNDSNIPIFTYITF